MESGSSSHRRRVRSDSESSDMKSCASSESPDLLKRIRTNPKMSDRKILFNEPTFSKLVRAKTFTIKDILGLDEEKEEENITAEPADHLKSSGEYESAGKNKY